jgi:iron complex transport system substrate-binding protein
VRKEKIAAREGWQEIPAVQQRHVYEIKSTYILQPGPASLTAGVAHIHRILAEWVRAEGSTR